MLLKIGIAEHTWITKHVSWSFFCFVPSLAFQPVNANSQSERALTNSHQRTRHSHLLKTIFWEAFTIHKNQHATEIHGANPRFSHKNS